MDILFHIIELGFINAICSFAFWLLQKKKFPFILLGPVIGILCLGYCFVQYSMNDLILILPWIIADLYWENKSCKNRSLPQKGSFRLQMVLACLLSVIAGLAIRNVSLFSHLTDGACVSLAILTWIGYWENRFEKGLINRLNRIPEYSQDKDQNAL